MARLVKSKKKVVPMNAGESNDTKEVFRVPGFEKIKDLNDLEQIASEYDDMKEKFKFIKDKKEELSTALKIVAQNYGVQDDKGSYYIQTESYNVGSVCKRTVKINKDRVIELCKKKGLVDCFKKKVVYEVVESKLEEHILSGDITQKEVDKFNETNTSYSVMVKPLKDMPEVESYTAAAKRK